MDLETIALVVKALGDNPAIVLAAYLIVRELKAARAEVVAVRVALGQVERGLTELVRQLQAARLRAPLA